jgi:hypothetical protein
MGGRYEAAIPVRLRWKGGGTIGEGDGREGGCDGRVAARLVRVIDRRTTAMGDEGSTFM